MINNKAMIEADFRIQLFRLSIAQVFILITSILIDKEYDFVFVPAKSIFLISAGFMIYLSILSKGMFYRQFMRRIIIGGVYPAIIFSLTGRAGLAFINFLLSPDRKLNVIFRTFLDSWIFYLWMVLFGIVCMFIVSIFENIRKGKTGDRHLNG